MFNTFETTGCHEHPDQPIVIGSSTQVPGSSSECWILVQQNDGCDVEFFKRNWDSYRDGFGDVSGNYWIGNEHLHQMTQLHDGLEFAVFHSKNYTFDKMVCKYDVEPFMSNQSSQPSPVCVP